MMRPRDRALAQAIAAKLRAVRMLRGMSREQLAELVNSYRPNVWRLESGKHVPSLQFLRDVARALDVSLSELLEGVDAEPSDAALKETA